MMRVDTDTLVGYTTGGGTPQVVMNISPLICALYTVHTICYMLQHMTRLHGNMTTWLRCLSVNDLLSKTSC